MKKRLRFETWTKEDMARCQELRHIIEYYGITQAAVGKLIGYSRVTINQMCNANKKIDPAKLEELRQLTASLEATGWPYELRSKR